jgi:hypothetical protein
MINQLNNQVYLKHSIPHVQSNSSASASEATQLQLSPDVSQPSPIPEPDAAARIALLEAELERYKADKQKGSIRKNKEERTKAVFNALNNFVKYYNTGETYLSRFLTLVGLGGIAIGGLLGVSQVPAIKSQLSEIAAPIQNILPTFAPSQESSVPANSPNPIAPTGAADFLRQQPISPTVTQPTSPTVTQSTSPTATQPTNPTVIQPTSPTVTQSQTPTQPRVEQRSLSSPPQPTLPPQIVPPAIPPVIPPVAVEEVAAPVQEAINQVEQTVEAIPDIPAQAQQVQEQIEQLRPPSLPVSLPNLESHGIFSGGDDSEDD